MRNACNNEVQLCNHPPKSGCNLGTVFFCESRNPDSGLWQFFFVLIVHLQLLSTTRSTQMKDGRSLAP